MIHSKQPLTFTEVKEIVKDLEEKQELKNYLKKFTKLSREKAEEIRKEIEKLNNMKIKEENMVKIIDFAPKDAESVNKIFTENTLTEEEANAILEIVGRH